MDTDRARSLLIAERDEVQSLLKDAEDEGRQARVAEVDSEAEDNADAGRTSAAEPAVVLLVRRRPVGPVRPGRDLHRGIGVRVAAVGHEALHPGRAG